MVLEISPITLDELPALAALYQQLIPNEASVAKMAQVLAENRDNPRHTVLAARVDGRLVGSLLAVTCPMLFGQCRSFMVVEDVVIDQAYRRQGIGSALMQAIEDQARTQNCSYVMLITDTDRVESQAFYTSLGYNSAEYCAFKKHL